MVERGRRLLATGALLLVGALLVAALPTLGPEQRQRALRAWYKALLRALRIRLEVTGGDRFADAAIGILVVSNHTSWLDVIALGAVQPLRMVADPKIKPGTGERDHRLGMAVSRSRDGGSCGQAAGSRVTL